MAYRPYRPGCNSNGSATLNEENDFLHHENGELQNTNVRLRQANRKLQDDIRQYGKRAFEALRSKFLKELNANQKSLSDRNKDLDAQLKNLNRQNSVLIRDICRLRNQIFIRDQEYRDLQEAFERSRWEHGRRVHRY
ncbi:MAG: hypothetical protein Q9166_000653 [cf. Caloplaca sp. 2 TL-2023]